MAPSVRALLFAGSLFACDPVATPIVALEPADAGPEPPDADPPDADSPDADTPDADAGDAEPDPCGDGVLQEGELCDDYGDPAPGTGCADDCQSELLPSCGDGVVTGDEVCDGAEAYCDACTAVVGECGDGTVQAEVEDCDTTTESASCDRGCTSVSCGDGYVNRAAGENCDDGVNDGSPGSCSSDCSDYALGPESATEASCKDLAPTSDGYYWLLAADATPYIAYCDATTESGGWTLIMRAIDWNFDYYDAIWSDETLVSDQVFDFVNRGRSKYRAYLEVAFEELRTTDADDFSQSFTVATAHPSALALFGANGGEGFGLSLASGPDALEAYFDQRAIQDERQWGCPDYIHVGLNLHALLNVTDDTPDSLATDTEGHCDWDGGARFGQRVNTCNYQSSSGQCTGNHDGQGWGSFQNRGGLVSHPIRQLLWVR